MVGEKPGGDTEDVGVWVVENVGSWCHGVSRDDSTWSLYAGQEGADSRITLKFQKYPFKVCCRILLCMLFGGEVQMDRVVLSVKIHKEES